MDIRQWKDAAIKHFKSGDATDLHWEMLASCLLSFSEAGGIDEDLDQVITDLAIANGADPRCLGD